MYRKIGSAAVSHAFLLQKVGSGGVTAENYDGLAKDIEMHDVSYRIASSSMTQPCLSTQWITYRIAGTIGRAARQDSPSGRFLRVRRWGPQEDLEERE